MLRPPETRRVAPAICLVAVALMAWSTWNDSPVVDEVPHIGAGYSYVRKGDMRLNPEHPPMVKDFAGLPLQFLHLKQTMFMQPAWTTDVNGQWSFGRMTLYQSGGNPETMLRLSRLAVLPFFLLACWLMWRWARERYGDTAALLSLLLFAFSPTVLAHGRLVTTDLAAATGVLAATYAFVLFLRTPTRRTFSIAALALGGALLTKFNVVLLGPFFVAIAGLWGLEGRLGSWKAWRRAAWLIGLTALVGLVAFIAVVWPYYGLHVVGYPPERQLADTTHIMSWQADNPVKSVALWAAGTPFIRAAGHWVFGLAMVIQRSGGGNIIYWLGDVVKQGGPAYFPLVYLLKEPLAWWILVACAAASLIVRRGRHLGSSARDSWWMRHEPEWVWLLWLAIYWGVSIKSTLNIGVRHLLPVYPFTILLVSGRIAVVLDWLRAHDRRRHAAFSLLIAILVGWYTFETVRVHPFPLTYFNQLAGGPSGGFRYVVDSNLDWGQDAKRLAMFADAHGIERICVDYFGWADAAWYLGGTRDVWTSSSKWKDKADFLRGNACDGWIAISGTFLQNSNGAKTFASDGDEGTYRWLLDEKPYTVVGNSIFVWHPE
jgi:dolichyl-phosphate-mannose--protein O-mannosyl transferase